MKSKPKSFAVKKKPAPAREPKPAAAPKDTPVRKIVQIALGGAEHWLLCDDGTAWFGSPGHWSQADTTNVTNPPPPPAPASEPAP
jgi:hypothetical protein